MTFKRRAAAVAAATLLAAAPAATSAASAADTQATQTFNGTWTQSTEQLTATTCADTSDVDGRWSVTLLKDGTANLSLALLLHGKLHAAWGGQALGDRATWQQTDTGYLLSSDPAALPWTFAIEGDTATLTIPNRYPTCSFTTATVSGTVR